MPVCLCLCTFIEIRKGTKNLDLVLCTVVYIGLGKTSVTIWTIGSLENWGNHWGKWTILRSFRTTWVTLHDCIGGVTWQHIVPGRFLQIDNTQFDCLNLCCQFHDNYFNYDYGVNEIQYDKMLYIDCASAQIWRKCKGRGETNKKLKMWYYIELWIKSDSLALDVALEG